MQYPLDRVRPHEGGIYIGCGNPQAQVDRSQGLGQKSNPRNILPSLRKSKANPEPHPLTVTFTALLQSSGHPGLNAMTRFPMSANSGSQRKGVS